MPIAVIMGAALLLAVGMLDLPYGYYTLLRLVATLVFGIGAIIAYERRIAVLPWIYLLIAITFNPFIKIHFEKEIWMWLDLSAGILLILTAHKIRAITTQE